MWDATVWAALTWLKLTVALVLVVAGCWWWFGTGSGQLAVAVIVAALAELHLTRALAREWATEAGMHWWWTR